MTVDRETRSFAFRVPVLASVIVVWIVVAVLRWDPPWNTVTVDDFTRTALAVRWADDPFWAEPGLLWLPGHTYLLGGLFFLTGAAFADNPLALAALANSFLVAAAALLLGATSRRVFRSDVGALGVVVVALYASWSRFLALSALVEPLYLSMLALALYATARWLEERTMRWLPVAAGALVVLGLTRYEGWAVWLIWLVVATSSAWRTGTARRLPLTAVALLPGVVPLVWMTANWLRFQDPLAFARTTAALFQSGFGGAQRPVGRLLYYPAGLMHADAILTFVVLVAVVVAWRKSVEARPLVAVIGGAFAVLWASSVASGAVGLQPERFVYPLLLSLAWAIAAFPEWLRERLGSRPAAALFGTAVGLFIGTAFLRVDPPTEWNYPPDLLETAVVLAEMKGTVDVLMPSDLPNEDAPLAITGGARVGVFAVSPEALAGVVDAGSGVVAVERIPARVARLPDPDLIIGRYHLYGSVAPNAGQDRCGHCDDWLLVDEHGDSRPLEPVHGVLALEFTDDNPAPGVKAELRRTLSLGPTRRIGSIEVLALYGRGFNPGRLAVEVMLSGQVLHTRDASTPGGWQAVSFDIPAGEGSLDLVVTVSASEDIEQTWGWGRASGVLVRNVDLGTSS